MASIEFVGRIINKHDTEENWNKANSFIPEQGEIIIYDSDGSNKTRIKVGDGYKTPSELDFIGETTKDIIGSALPESVSSLKDSEIFSGMIQGEIRYYNFMLSEVEDLPNYSEDSLVYAANLTVIQTRQGNGHATYIQILNLDNNEQYIRNVTYYSGNYTTSEWTKLITDKDLENLSTPNSSKIVSRSGDSLELENLYNYNFFNGLDQGDIEYWTFTEAKIDFAQDFPDYPNSNEGMFGFILINSCLLKKVSESTAFFTQKIVTGTGKTYTRTVETKNMLVTPTSEWESYTFNELVDKIYPVGSIYLTVDSNNPMYKFGGSWVEFGKGRVLVGVNSSDTDFNTVEKTGGEKTHKLTTSEIPSHTHTMTHTHSDTFAIASAGAHSHRIGYDQDVSGGGLYASVHRSGTSGADGTAPTNSAGAHTHTLNGAVSSYSGSTGSSGTGGTHNNLQPYITCYMWKRIS